MSGIPSTVSPVRKDYKPRPYQAIGQHHLLETPRCALWAGMGMGKTVITETVLDTLSLTDGRPALVLAPLRPLL